VLPQETVQKVREAVNTNKYASSSGVMGVKLYNWNQMCAARQQGLSEVRRVWKQAAQDQTPGVAPEKVLDRLEQKYRAAAGRGRTQKREKCT
jgi:Arc/MetJ-type ribon-helix-helix transcriptional regulator